LLQQSFYESPREHTLKQLEAGSEIMLRAEQTHLAGRVAFFSQIQLRVPARPAHTVAASVQQSFALLNLQQRVLLDARSMHTQPIQSIEVAFDMFAAISDPRTAVVCHLGISSNKAAVVRCW
jgi:hypothetical protein